MQSILQQLKSSFSNALVAAYGNEFADTDPLVVLASNPKFGDYQANVALSLTKKLGKPPRTIAQELITKLDVEDFCQPPQIAGPGFINLTLQPEYLERFLKTIQGDELSLIHI